MRERNARRLVRLAAVMALLVAVSAPAEADFWSWLKKLLGGDYIPPLVQAAPPVPGVSDQPEPDRLMLFDLRAVKASPLPGAPENCWSPVAVDPTTIAVLSGAGHSGGRQEAGLWVYSRRTGMTREVIPAAALPAGSRFFAIGKPDPSTAGSLVVVLKATQPTLRALVLLANLRTRRLEVIPDVQPIDGDPARSPEVLELLTGTRVRQRKWVGVVTEGDGGGSAPRHHLIIESFSLGDGVRVQGALELDPRDGKDCADPNWLSDTEIIYVAKQWPPV